MYFIVFGYQSIKAVVLSHVLLLLWRAIIYSGPMERSHEHYGHGISLVLSSVDGLAAPEHTSPTPKIQYHYYSLPFLNSNSFAICLCCVIQINQKLAGILFNAKCSTMFCIDSLHANTISTPQSAVTSHTDLCFAACRVLFCHDKIMIVLQWGFILCIVCDRGGKIL